ncbi:hypothetical protein H5410_054447 [Solanum commersonii]|uniref:Uncharacterized protein n=1 Tax=Solanum commersonii TaxID=4109 RepID=A0A9J5WEZ1_SOLCO|nr:hypothetical protein H5410_054447 [Solanum commersonii]
MAAAITADTSSTVILTTTAANVASTSIAQVYPTIAAADAASTSIVQVDPTFAVVDPRDKVSIRLLLINSRTYWPKSAKTSVDSAIAKTEISFRALDMTIAKTKHFS